MSGASKKLVRYSQLQRQVLKLYAGFVRLSQQRPGLLETVRHEFRLGAALSPKKDSLLIDYKLRRAANQLDMLKTSRVKAVKIIDLEQQQQQQHEK